VKETIILHQHLSITGCACGSRN